MKDNLHRKISNCPVVTLVQRLKDPAFRSSGTERYWVFELIKISSAGLIKILSTEPTKPVYSKLPPLSAERRTPFSVPIKRVSEEVITIHLKKIDVESFSGK